VCIQIGLMISIHILCLFRMVVSSLGHHIRLLRHFGLSASRSEIVYTTRVS